MGARLLLLLVLPAQALCGAADDARPRQKRSNIPCGSSFTPCNRRPVGFTRPFESANQLDADLGANQFVTAPNIRRQMIVLAAQEALEDVDRLFNATEPFLRRNGRTDRIDASRYWSTYRKSYSYAKDISYSAFVSIGVSQRLRSFGLRPAEIIYGLPKTDISGTALQQVCPANVIEECVPGKYRTYSGYCNNVNHPFWGAALEPLQRYLAPDYADEVSLPRVAQDGSDLPNARLVSLQLFAAPAAAHYSCTMLLAQWAHFVFNDVVQLGEVKGKDLAPLPCCDADVQHPECFSVALSRDDPVHRGFSTCMPYARSTPAPRANCQLGPREQANFATSYLDASGVYGSMSVRAQELRAFAGGQLRTSNVPFLRDLLPPAEFERASCRGSASQPCFSAGSDKVNVEPTLTAMHTVFMRHHNRLATELGHVNPHWDDERLYQEARRIVGAQVQHITFSEFLPVILGKDNMNKFALSLENNGYYSDYNLNVDSSAVNSFAAAAGLFFFTLLPEQVVQYAKDGRRVSQQPLSDGFYKPGALYFQDRLDGMLSEELRFLMQEKMLQHGLHMNAEMRNKLFTTDGQTGGDMAALLVQMGRDHGIPSYTVWRAQCGLGRPSSFDDLLADVRDPQVIASIRRLYRHIDDVDLFVLGLAEKPVKGALVGPTFACILGKQFQKLRRGDRFWYENFFFPSAFTETQLNELRKTTLARIICDNTDDLGKAQPSVMSIPDKFENCPIDCNSTVIDSLDLLHWLDSEPKLHLPITQDTLNKAVKLGTRHARELQEREGQLIRLRDTGAVRPGEALFAHSTLLSAKRESLDLARTANILLATTKVLVRGDGLEEGEKLPRELDERTLQRLLPQVDVSRIIGNVSLNNEACVPQPLPCDHTTPYRTYSGWCNNLRFPAYGNAFGPYRRLLDPAYNDGFDEPRYLDASGRPLPSPRAISTSVHATTSHTHVKYTHMLMQFGQFIDHDMTLAPVARGVDDQILNCSRCDSFETVSVNCFPIGIPASDPYFPTRNQDGSQRCIPFGRSLLGQLNLGYRNQINQLTGFIDASNVYGSTECEANNLRLYSMGKLNYTDAADGLTEGLPQGNQEPDCRSAPRHKCFVAGDERNNEHPALTAMHTVWMREHNRIATRLHRINNFWPDEKIYQETRRIVGALMQHIAYTEFLPKVLGCDTMSRYDLVPRKTGYYSGYDPRCDPGISNAFSTAAFRFGHSLIRSEFPRMDDFYHNLSSTVQLRDVFKNATPIYDTSSGGIDTLLIGLIGVAAENFDRHITEDVRDRLFEEPGVPFSGMDLPAINVQRGRDHGLPSYNRYRELCGMRRARSFSDLQDTTDAEAMDALSSVYRHVDDIDLFPGLMSERPVNGALVGPTAACLLAEQFQRLRRCDRFWYENDLSATRFTPDQLAEIRKVSLAKVICSNSQFIRMVQPRVLDIPDSLLNAQIACQDLPEMDLYEWLDRQFCVVDHRVINLGKTKRITPCVACTCTSEGPECHSIRIRSCVQLLDDYLFTEVMEDTVCMIQCSGLIRRRAGRV